MGVSAVFALLLSCGIGAVASKVKVTPATLTVLRGDAAHFTCSTSSSDWPAMVWLLDGTVVLTISRVHGVLRDSHNVTAEQVSTGGWRLVLMRVERIHDGLVTCDVQGVQDTASLFVQEKGSVKVMADARLAFRGQLVAFACRAAGWHPEPALQWLLGDKEVSPSEYNISREEVAAAEGRSLITVTSNLSVMAARSSNVSCQASVSALRTPLSSSLRLTVVSEVIQEAEDCTASLVAAAVLGAALLLLLLLLLCGCTVVCYRRRQTKLSQQEASGSDQWVSGPGLVARATPGRVNLGYFSEGTTDADFRGEISVVKVPDLVISGSQSQLSEGQSTWESRWEETPPNVRRITTV